MEYESIRCKDCGGVVHPATGCVYSSTYIVCGPCNRKAWEWFRAHVMGKGLSFYDHVNVISKPIILPSNGSE